MIFLDTIKQSSFIKHNAIFFVGSVVVGALNYLYYPILGRLMGPSEFGEIQVLVSLFLQFTIFLNVLSMITVNIVANYNDSTKAHRVIFELEKIAAYIAVAILAASIIFGEFLRQQLQFTSVLPFIALALAILVSIPLTFRSAYARGQKRFGIASMSQLIGAAAKIVFSVLLVVAGLGVIGAMFGIVIAQFIAFLYAARWASRVGFKRPHDTSYKTLPNIKVVAYEIKYAGVVFGGLLSITLLMSVDIVLVKYFFDAHTAGLYAGVATIARIIFFITTPIAQVLMPLVKIDQPSDKNNKLLLKSLGLTMAAGGGTLLILCIAPEPVMQILLGKEYIQYANLLPMLSVAIFLISIINLIFMYFMSLRKKMITLIGIIGFAVLVGMMLVSHATLHDIVQNMVMGSIFTATATGIYVLVVLKRGVRYAEQDDINCHSNL